MPKSVERCVNKLKKEKGDKSAWAICQASNKNKSQQKKKIDGKGPHGKKKGSK